MATRYSYGATPRRKRSIPSGIAVAIVSALLGFLLAGAIFLGVNGHIKVTTEAEQRPATVRKITHDSLGPTYLYNGEIIRWYVWTDPDKGIQYLVNDRGGGMPRRERNGEIVGVVHDE